MRALLLRSAGLAGCLLGLVCCQKDQDADHITMMDQVYYFADNQTAIVLPTSFTPNGDSLNDLYRPVITGVTPVGYSFTVHALSGQELFRSNVPGAGWDGRMPDTHTRYAAGTYWAELVFRPSNGGTVDRNFYFTLPAYNSVQRCTPGTAGLYFEDQIDPLTGKILGPSAEPACP